MIEMQDCLGGMATAGMMSHWGGRSSSKILQEIYDRAAAMGPLYGGIPGNAGENAINHEVQKILFDTMMKEAGVEVLFYTIVCGAIVEEGTVQGVIVQNKSGRSVIRAQRVIDATGDGDAAAACGVPFTKGREEDGKMQPCTLMFKAAWIMSVRFFPGRLRRWWIRRKGNFRLLPERSSLRLPAMSFFIHSRKRAPSAAT